MWKMLLLITKSWHILPSNNIWKLLYKITTTTSFFKREFKAKGGYYKRKFLLHHAASQAISFIWQLSEMELWKIEGRVSLFFSVLKKRKERRAPPSIKFLSMSSPFLFFVILPLSLVKVARGNEDDIQYFHLLIQTPCLFSSFEMLISSKTGLCSTFPYC